MRGMRRIHANTADLMAIDVEDVDLVFFLKNLDLEFQRQNEGRRLGAALVARIGKVYPGELSVAALLYDFRGLRG